jgi:hypothetical protein
MKRFLIVTGVILAVVLAGCGGPTPTGTEDGGEIGDGTPTEMGDETPTEGETPTGSEDLTGGELRYHSVDARVVS